MSNTHNNGKYELDKISTRFLEVDDYNDMNYLIRVRCIWRTTFDDSLNVKRLIRFIPYFE